jgi:hypothetical protein
MKKNIFFFFPIRIAIARSPDAHSSSASFSPNLRFAHIPNHQVDKQSHTKKKAKKEKEKKSRE